MTSYYYNKNPGWKNWRLAVSGDRWELQEKVGPWWTGRGHFIVREEQRE